MPTPDRERRGLGEFARRVLATPAAVWAPVGAAALGVCSFVVLAALLAEIVARRRMKTYLLAVAAALTLLVGVTRVYLGVHYPSDVLGGWSLGVAWALACALVARRLP